MLGLLLYLILSCVIQLPGANCQTQNVSRTSSAAPAPATTEMPTSPTVRPTTVHRTQSPTTTGRSSRSAVGSSAQSGPSPGPRQTSLFKILKDNCQPALLMIGGLIIACTALILSTLVLAWKVCLLSKRVSALNGSSADLTGQMERTRATPAGKDSPSETELREGSMLMADHLRDGKGGTEEEEEEEEEKEEKEAGAANLDRVEEAEEAGKKEEASPAPAKNCSSPAPQEEPAKAEPTSESTEKPKDEV